MWFLRQDHERRTRKALSEYERSSTEWTALRDDHLRRAQAIEAENQQRLNAWEERRQAHLIAQRVAREEYARRIRTDDAFMEIMLERALAQMKWPRETLVSLEVADPGRAIFLDVDLPEIEDLPARTSAIASDGRRLIVKNKSQRSLRAEYARHVHGVAFRLAGAAFTVLPGLERAVISCFSQRLDKSTGKFEDEYLFSVDIDHERFSSIDFSNLSRVDPVEALAAFPIRRRMSKGGTFKRVEPFTINAGYGPCDGQSTSTQ